MRSLLAAAAAALVLASGGSALAFGTIHGLGQDAEHERITRRALGCLAAGAFCLERGTLDELAGKDKSFGAVGAPDRGRLTFESRAHCDGGDHLPQRGYPQSAAAARGALEACRAFMARMLDEAVADAERLLDDDGDIRGGQVGLGCVFAGSVKGRAKCNVLQDMGVVLHASQDFYSHSNWVDRPDTARAAGLDNPPGLGRTGPAAFISLRSFPALPEGLITGCFGIPEASRCQGRVMHASLNKDGGEIDPQVGAGSTPRGGVQGNFRRAVEAAVADSRDKWALLRERLVAEYGRQRGERMMCALAKDDPEDDC